MAEENSRLTDEDMRQDALRFSRDCLPTGATLTTGLYTSGVKKTAKELIEDAETIFKYLKFGKQE